MAPMLEGGYEFATCWVVGMSLSHVGMSYNTEFCYMLEGGYEFCHMLEGGYEFCHMLGGGYEFVTCWDEL